MSETSATFIIYSHRNGEIEPPDESGIYWCWDKYTHSRALYQLAFMPTGDVQYRCLTVDNGGWHHFNAERMRMESLHWWGPIVAPWEPNQNPEMSMFPISLATLGYLQQVLNDAKKIGCFGYTDRVKVWLDSVAIRVRGLPDDNL